MKVTHYGGKQQLDKGKTWQHASKRLLTLMLQAMVGTLKLGQRCSDITLLYILHVEIPILFVR